MVRNLSIMLCLFGAGCMSSLDPIYADAKRMRSPEYAECLAEQSANQAEYQAAKRLYDENVLSAKATYPSELAAFEEGKLTLRPVLPELRFTLPAMPHLKNCLVVDGVEDEQ